MAKPKGERGKKRINKNKDWMYVKNRYPKEFGVVFGCLMQKYNFMPHPVAVQMQIVEATVIRYCDEYGIPYSRIRDEQKKAKAAAAQKKARAAAKKAKEASEMFGKDEEA